MSETPVGNLCRLRSQKREMSVGNEVEKGKTPPFPLLFQHSFPGPHQGRSRRHTGWLDSQCRLGHVYWTVESSALKGGTSLPPPYSKELDRSMDSAFSSWDPLAICLDQGLLSSLLPPTFSVSSSDGSWVIWGREDNQFV